MKFQVGDRVKCVRIEADSDAVIGKVGTILGIGRSTVRVKWENFHKGHGDNNDCWNVYVTVLELDGSKIVEAYGIVKFLNSIEKR
jgi:hypothetical protein